MRNYDEFKNQKTAEQTARNVLIDKLMEILPDIVGEENITRTEDGIAVCTGERTMRDGTIGEVCQTIMVRAEKCDDTVSNKGKVVKAFERILAGENYEFKKMEDEEKEEQKKVQMEEKKKALAIAKAERLRAKYEAIMNSIK